jgi:EpsI family protein
MAEGVLHDFEGLVVFLGCTALLVAQMWLLARIGPSPLPLRSAFGLDFPAPTPKSALVRYRSLPASFVAALGLLAGAALVAAALPARNPERPERHELLQFPMSIDAWRGQPERIDRAALDVLNADDTLLANYRDARGNLVNLYVAYFAAQSRAAEAHSPRICIPGGGWDIESLRPVTLEGVPFGDAPLRVNRVVISRGEQRQLVYYWFQQRGRNITHEYAAKWFILVDQIRINRSDGAMVRLTTPIRRGEDEAQAESRLNAFAAELVPLLAAYIPGAPDEPGRASVARR